jgi:hypothetical protein
MRLRRPAPIIPAMTRTQKSSKVLLVADRRAERTTSTATPVRRYRLARLRMPTGAQETESRFEYLKNVYD